MTVSHKTPATADPIAALIEELQRTIAPPLGAVQQLAIPIPGVDAFLIRSSNRAAVQGAADKLMDPFQAGSPGIVHVRGPRRDGRGGWWAIVTIERFEEATP